MNTLALILVTCYVVFQVSGSIVWTVLTAIAMTVWNFVVIILKIAAAS